MLARSHVVFHGQFKYICISMLTCDERKVIALLTFGDKGEGNVRNYKNDAYLTLENPLDLKNKLTSKLL